MRFIAGRRDEFIEARRRLSALCASVSLWHSVMLAENLVSGAKPWDINKGMKKPNLTDAFFAFSSCLRAFVFSSFRQLG